MADILNARDLTIQAQLPRLIPVTMPGNITVPTTNVPGLPDYYASSKQLELKATSQIFQISKVGGTSPSAIILTALKRNILGTVTWTVVSGTVDFTTGNDTLTIQAGGLTSDTATIRASVTSDGTTYSDVMTIVRVEEGVDSVTGFLTNESTSVPALANGSVLSYDNTGGQFRVLKGITDVTGTAVTYSVVSSTGINISIANTGVYTVNNLTVDAGSAILQASYGGVNIQKVYTITKSKQGAAGVTTYTWIKYADTAAGAGLSDSPTGKLYIGLAYNKTTPTESTNPADYEFALIKGADGQNGTDGTNGIPGPPGANGETLYTWIKYSDFPDGTNPYDTPNTNTSYIGIAVNKTTATESTNKADYSWSKFKGDQGVPGTNGSNGVRGTVNISVATTGSIWSDDAANTGIANAGYGVPQSRDIVTLYNTSSSFSQSKYYDGTAWQTLDAYINGNLLVTGSVVADKIDSRGLAIKDSAGNVILSAGVALDKNYLNFGAGTGNLITNSGPFPGTKGAFVAAYQSVNGKTVVFDASYDPYRPVGSGGIYANVPDGMTSSESITLAMMGATGEIKIPVVAGQRYETSAYISAHRCQCRMSVVFVDSSGNAVGSVFGSTTTSSPTGPLTNWEATRSVGFATAPAGSVYALIRPQMFGTGEGTPYIFLSMAYFGIALANQTTPTAWSDGPGATFGGNVYGQITPGNASTYIADAAIRFAAIDKATINNLSVVSQLVGLLRTRDSGARMEIADDVIRIYNDSGNIKIKIGKLD
jgi:hypothetical protein